MKEIRDIIAAHDAAVGAGKQTALATVVQVEGSSYRREGARMLISEDGLLTGAISGGCLEGDALRKALLVMAQQLPMLVTYDTVDEDDAKLGLGLGCNGVIHILIEPVNTRATAHPILLLKAVAARREPAVLVTIFSLDKKAAQPGTCLLRQLRGVLQSQDLPVHISRDVLADAGEALRENSSAVKRYDGCTALHDVIKPALSLIICGAGNDAVPLTQMAHTLGWATTVVDGRPAYATAARFPAAQRILVARPEAAMAALDPDQQTAVVLMTHNYQYDLSMLRQLLPLQAVPYIGVLGPKKKLERMLEELSGEGHRYSDCQLERLYGPTGLDIGAAAPEEIALSILAEIQAVLSRKSGNALREKALPIHASV